MSFPVQWAERRGRCCADQCGVRQQAYVEKRGSRDSLEHGLLHNVALVVTHFLVGGVDQDLACFLVDFELHGQQTVEGYRSVDEFRKMCLNQA